MMRYHPRHRRPSPITLPASLSTAAVAGLVTASVTVLNPATTATAEAHSSTRFVGQTRVHHAVQVVRRQKGDPYVYGAAGPSAFDCLVAGTLVTTTRGEIPIECVTSDDYVLTRVGYRRVLRAWKVRDNAETVEIIVNGRTLRGTPEHRVWTENRGWTSLAAITPFDTLVLCQAPSGSSSRESPTTATRTQTRHRTGRTSSDLVGASTGPSGRPSTGQSLRGTRSTTSTTTRSTTPSTIWTPSHSPSIAARAQQHGDSMTTSASSAGSSFRPQRHPRVTSGSAAPSTSRSSTTTRLPLASVYDLSVEGEHEFFAEGVLVHNCSGLFEYAFGKAGVWLPRTSDGQSTYVRRIPAKHAHRGDFAFFYDSSGHVFHVVMIAGHHDHTTTVLEAAHTGTDVRHAEIWHAPHFYGTLRRRG